jgi:AcrR family transcriptional regulator
MAQRAPVTGPTRRADAGERERRQDRILAAALDEFASRGFDGTTTAGVARRAGVTQSLVHYHFATKDQLWRAAVTTVLADMQGSFTGSYGELADLDPLARLKVLVRRFVNFSAAYPEFGRILSYEGAVGGARLEWLLDQDAARQLAGFAALLEQGVAEGWVKPLPLAHVTTCLGAACAYAFIAHETMRRVYGVDVSDPEVVDAHADTVVELFFHGLVVPQREAGPNAVTIGPATTAGSSRRQLGEARSA